MLKTRTRPEAPVATDPATVCVLGLESVGKSTLLQSLTGLDGRSEAMRGATLYCERYRDSDSGLELMDTPGLVRECDSETTREALGAFSSSSSCLLVLRATTALKELQVLWPLVRRKALAVVLTNRDLLTESPEQRADKLEIWRSSLGVPVALVDSRELTESEKEELRQMIPAALGPRECELSDLPEWNSYQTESSNFFLDNRFTATVLLFVPIFLATYFANYLADSAQPWLNSAVEKAATLTTSSVPLNEVLFGPYGLVAMLPFLFLYALPTIVLFSFLLAIYKSTGLLDRLSLTVHPFIRVIGLSGRDAVRVIMGFGCNVPAVVATRACHSCSRGSCVSAIAFGAACSYQLPATVAVFAAAGHPELTFWYLTALLITTALYLRFTTPRWLRQRGGDLVLEERSHLHPVNWRQAFRDTKLALMEFFRMALPVFFGLCVGASLLRYTGVLSTLGDSLRPVMAMFNLPPEAATAVILGSVRKDGIAIGLLEPSWGALKVPGMDAGQLLTSVYLAGLLLPCLVTLLTIARELGIRHAARLALRQAAWASMFACCIAWGIEAVSHLIN